MWMDTQNDTLTALQERIPETYTEENLEILEQIVSQYRAILNHIANTKDPDNTEEKLSEILDKKYWIKLNSIIVRYGQNVCLPVKPQCIYCKLKENCNYYKEKDSQVMI